MAQAILLASLVASGPLDAGRWHAVAGVVAGWSLFFAAGVLGISGVASLGATRTTIPMPRSSGTLVRSGPYAWCRHPLYASVLLAGFGWALLWQSAATAILAALQVPFFGAKARLEERYLTARFPEYESYARRTKRFVPGLY